jgi:hypothetical protein
MIQKNILFTFIYLSLGWTCLAQKKKDNFGDVAQSLRQFSNTHFEENIYLHINSSFLLVGESVLFKAYCLKAVDNTTSSLSSVAYVELIDANANPVLRSKILLKEGEGSGDFFLPSTLSSGNYTLIAYTQWMRNYSIQKFFKTQITIINPFRKSTTDIPKKKSQVQIEFFPEGGTLLSGVENLVAFRVLNEKMKAVNFLGKILDETGNIALEFSPTANGVGRFTFIPLSGKEYKAVVIDSLQNIYFQKLPPVVVEGIGVHVIENESAFQVNLTSRSLGKNIRTKILVQHKTAPIIEVEIQFVNEQAKYDLKKELLPWGISQLIILNPTNQVACERSIFYKPINIAKPDLQLERNIYKTRDKVSLTLAMKDTFPAYLSMSVRKIEKKIVSTSSITNYLFLGKKDLEMNSLQKSASMDDQLLIHSDSHTVLQESTLLKYLPEIRGNLITGTIMMKDNTTPVIKEKVYLSIPSKEYLFFASITDSVGRFYFSTDKILFNADLIVQIAPTSCPDCKIKLDAMGLEDYSGFKPSELEIDSSYRKLIERRSILSQIENAYYSQKQDSIIDKSPNFRFYGKPDKAYKLDDFVRFPTMQDVLIEYVQEVILKKKIDRYEIKAMDIRKRLAFSQDPLILIDGIPIFDSNQVINYNPLWLEKIEVVGRRYFYGPLETHGIISLTTYAGDGKNISMPQKEKYIGIQPRKLHFSPKYDSNSPTLSKIPDYRTQLYWNPSLTVSNDKLPIEFYTSDEEGDFEIIIEGILVNGIPIHHKEIIHVSH